MKATHTELQRQITDLLAFTGWKFLHARKSVGYKRGAGRGWTTALNITGWPDLAPIWNPRQPGRFLAIEIKVATKLTPEQESVLAELAACGFECYVVREEDLEDLAKVLTPNGHAPTGSALSFGFAPTERTTP